VGIDAYYDFGVKAIDLFIDLAKINGQELVLKVFAKNAASKTYMASFCYYVLLYNGDHYSMDNDLVMYSYRPFTLNWFGSLAPP